MKVSYVPSLAFMRRLMFQISFTLANKALNCTSLYETWLA